MADLSRSPSPVSVCYLSGNFTSRMQELSSMPTFTDFTITCKNREWRVHRVILALHSKVLEKACTSDFREATTAKLDLSAECEDVVSALMQFLYSFDYKYHPIQIANSAAVPSASIAPGPLEFHIMVAKLADQHDIDSMKEKAVQKFEERLKDPSNDLNDLTTAIRLAYSARGVLGAICRHIVGFMVELESSIISADTTELAEAAEAAQARKTVLAEVMSDTPSLALDVLSAFGTYARVNSSKDDFDTFQCPSCYKDFAATIPNDEYRQAWCPGCCEERNGREWNQLFLTNSGFEPREALDRGDWWHKETM